MTNKPTAYWDVSLWADCPICKESVNLMDDPEFFSDSDIEPCQSKVDYEVICPECGEGFITDIDY